MAVVSMKGMNLEQFSFPAGRNESKARISLICALIFRCRRKCRNPCVDVLNQINQGESPQTTRTKHTALKTISISALKPFYVANPNALFENGWFVYNDEQCDCIKINLSAGQSHVQRHGDLHDVFYIEIKVTKIFQYYTQIIKKVPYFSYSIFVFFNCTSPSFFLKTFKPVVNPLNYKLNSSQS